MKTPLKPALLAIALAAFAQLGAQAQILTSIGTGVAGPNSSYAANIGLQYVVGADPINITNLGILVTDGETGIAGASTVNLWEPTGNAPFASTGTLIASQSFAAGAGSGQADDSFYYGAALSTPITLDPGTVFILTRSGGSDWVNNDSMTGMTTGSDVSFSASSSPGNPSRIPNGDGTDTTAFPDGHAEVYITANAEYSVIPEPSTLALGLISGAALMALYRLRRIAS
jgi:hypothetical protein